MKKNRLFGILLSLALMLTMMPAMAFAQDDPDMNSAEIQAEASEDVSVQGYDTLWIAGGWVTSERTSGSGWSYTPASGDNPAKLTLDGFEYSGNGYNHAAIYSKEELTIELKNNNTITQTVASEETNGYGVIVEGLLTITGSGNLTATTDGLEYSSAGIYAYSVLINSGTVNANSNGQYFGIVGSNTVTVSGGTVNAVGAVGGIYAGSGSIIVTGGTLTAKGIDAYGFEANIVEISRGIVETSGRLYGIIARDRVDISGGTVTTSGSESGIYTSYGAVAIADSKVAAEGYHAIFANSIHITDSRVDDSKGRIYSHDELTIRDSIVKTEGITYVLEGDGGVNIEYTGSGKYSTYVEASAKGTDYGTNSLSAKKIDYSKIAIWSKENKLTIDEKLTISKPENGKTGHFEATSSLPAYTTIVDSKGDPADHVIIEAQKPAPAPATAGPVVTTTAKSSARSMKIKWSWDKASTAKSYKVAYRKAGSSKWKVKTTKKTKYVVKGLKTKGLYEFKVAAVTDTGDVWSDVHYRYFKKVQTKAKAGTGTIKVSWKKDKKATGYEVFVANNKKMKDAQVFQVASSEKSYAVSGLGTGKYYVKVRPVKSKDGVTYTGIKCSARKVKVK